MDGTLVETTGACKAGMDIAYNGVWGYHPLVVSLAETGEVLRLVNRSGNRPSHDGAAEQVDRVLWLCLRAGFRRPEAASGSCGATPTSHRPNTSTAGTHSHKFASCSVTTPWPT